MPPYNKAESLAYKEGLYTGSDVLVFSERLKYNKKDPILPISESMVKPSKSSNDSGSKIKVIDKYETQFEQREQSVDPLTRSSPVPPLSDISPLLANSQLQSDQHSFTQDQTSGRRRPNLTASEGPTALKHVDVIDLESREGLSPIARHQEFSPTSNHEDLNSSAGMPGSPSVENLKKYIENQSSDINWLIGDKIVKRDNSFEEEVKTCRKQFLIETMTDFVLSELLNELKSEKIYFKKSPPQEEQRISLQLLDDPRYVTESSDEETIYGIRTNMNAVFEYCNLLVRFILDNYLDLLLEKYNHKRVTTPAKVLSEIREREVLLGLAGSQWNEIVRFKNFGKSKEKFFPEFIFESLEQEIISNYNNMNIMQNLFDMQKVYHRSIFDCFNEIMTERWMCDNDADYYKIAVHGKEYRSRRILNLPDLEDLIIACKDSAVEYSTMMCGVIRDKEDSLLGNLRTMPAERIELIREDRLFRFLCFEAIDMENSFTNYSKDEVYTLLDCADTIFDTLVSELVEDLTKIRK